MPLDCTVHHLGSSVQPRGYTGMGEVFPLGLENLGDAKACSSQEILNRLKKVGENHTKDTGKTQGI